MILPKREYWLLRVLAPGFDFLAGMEGSSRSIETCPGLFLAPRWFA